MTRLDIAPSAEAPPEMDGEVTSAAELIAVAENTSNAGNSYWMRGGSYGNLTLDTGARPASTITFITYPGEVVTFGETRFEGCRNITLDGNEDNMTRGTAGGYPDGDYGLWFRGNGVTGFDIPDVPEVMAILGSGSSDVQNLTLKNFRLGDDTDTDETQWRCQHGVVILPGVYDVVFEDFELSYLGADIADFDPVTGDGDAAGGGYGLWWGFQGGSTDSGNFTFRRGHFHHTMNDFMQYGPYSPTALVLFEDCLFEELTNFGDAHADLGQIFGGSQELTYDGCVFRSGTDFLWHGDVTGQPRTLNNCLLGMSGAPINNPTLGKDNEGGIDAQWVFQDCSMEFINSLRLDATGGSSFAPSPKSKIRNSIYPGFSTITGVNRNNVFENDGQANVITDGGTGVTGDTTASPAPTYNSQGECTNYSQGWRKPASFPWTL